MKVRIKLGRSKPYDGEPSLAVAYTHPSGHIQWQPASLQQWDEQKGEWVDIPIVANDESQAENN